MLQEPYPHLASIGLHIQNSLHAAACTLFALLYGCASVYLCNGAGCHVLAPCSIAHGLLLARLGKQLMKL